VLCRGEPGIGKTRLAEELAATAAMRAASPHGSGSGGHGRCPVRALAPRAPPERQRA
jgi:hypothetical protein